MGTSQADHGNGAMETMFLECFKMMWKNVYAPVLTVGEKGIINSLGNQL